MCVYISLSLYIYIYIYQYTYNYASPSWQRSWDVKRFEGSTSDNCHAARV